MENANPNADEPAANRPTNDAIDDAELVAAFSEIVNNEQAINWKYWAEQMPRWTAAQAARLMCALDPDVFENLDSRPNRNNPTDLVKKAKKIQRLAEAQNTGFQSPAEWLDWAVSHGLHVHVGLRLAVDAVNAGVEAHEPDKPTFTTAKGITKAQVLAAFGKLVKNINLTKALGNGKGLFGDNEARTKKGSPGGKHAALWNPVILAVGLKYKYSVPMPHLKRVFSDCPFLMEWRDEWDDALTRLGE